MNLAWNRRAPANRHLWEPDPDRPAKAPKIVLYLRCAACGKRYHYIPEFAPRYCDPPPEYGCTSLPRPATRARAEGRELPVPERVK